MRISKHYWIRAISFCLALILPFTQGVQIPPLMAETSPASFSAIPFPPNVPEKIGSVTAHFQGSKKSPFVFLIQDAHTIYDAQRSIQKLIEFLEKQYGVNLVGVEGAKGKLDTTLFRAFPENEIKAKVFNAYLEKGEWTGAQMAAIGNSKALYHGLEDWEIYKKNFLTFQAVVGRREENLKKLEETERDLDRQRARIYSPGLNQFHNQRKAFEAGTLPLQEMLTVPGTRSEGAWHRYPALHAFVRAISNEENSESHLNELTQIQAGTFSKELKRFISEVEAKLITRSEEKALARKYRQLELLRKLVKLELTRDEWEEIKAFSVERRGGREDFLNAKHSTLNANFDFYRLAEARDAAFHQNLGKLLKKHNSPSAAVIAGGFHAPAFEKYLKSQNISYAVISPAIASLQGEEHYAGLMRGEFSYRHELKTTLYDAFTRHATGELLKVWNPESQPLKIKRWRDEVIRELAVQDRLEKVSQYTPYLDLRMQSREGMLQTLKKELRDAFEKAQVSLNDRFENQLLEFEKGLRELAGRKEITPTKVGELVHQIDLGASGLATLAVSASDPRADSGFILRSPQNAGVGGRSELRQVTRPSLSPEEAFEPTTIPASQSLADVLEKAKIDPLEFTTVIYPGAGNHDADLLAVLQKTFPQILEYHLNSLSYKDRRAAQAIKENLYEYLNPEKKDKVTINTYAEDYYEVELAFSVSGRRIWIDKFMGENAAEQANPEFYVSAIRRGIVRPGDLILSVPFKLSVAQMPWKKRLAAGINIPGYSKWDNWAVFEVTQADVNALAPLVPTRSELREKNRAEEQRVDITGEEFLDFIQDKLDENILDGTGPTGRKIRSILNGFLSQPSHYGFSNSDEVWSEILSIYGERIPKIEKRIWREENVSGYIYKTVKNALRDQERKERRYRKFVSLEREIQDEEGLNLRPVNVLRSREPNPAQAAESKEMWESLALHLSHQSQMFRQALGSIFYEKIPQKDLKKIEGMTKSSYRRQLKQIERQLVPVWQREEVGWLGAPFITAGSSAIWQTLNERPELRRTEISFTIHPVPAGRICQITSEEFPDNRFKNQDLFEAEFINEGKLLTSVVFGLNSSRDEVFPLLMNHKIRPPREMHSEILRKLLLHFKNTGIKQVYTPLVYPRSGEFFKAQLELWGARWGETAGVNSRGDLFVYLESLDLNPSLQSVTDARSEVRQAVVEIEPKLPQGWERTLTSFQTSQMKRTHIVSPSGGLGHSSPPSFIQHLIQHLPIGAGRQIQNILLVGSGNLRTTALLNLTGAKVTIREIDDKRIQAALSNARSLKLPIQGSGKLDQFLRWIGLPEQGIQLLKGDAFDPAFDRSRFDLIYFFYTQPEEKPEKIRFLHEDIVDALTLPRTGLHPGAYFVLAYPPKELVQRLEKKFHFRKDLSAFVARDGDGTFTVHSEEKKPLDLVSPEDPDSMPVMAVFQGRSEMRMEIQTQGSLKSQGWEVATLENSRPPKPGKKKTENWDRYLEKSINVPGIPHHGKGRLVALADGMNGGSEAADFVIEALSKEEGGLFEEILKKLGGDVEKTLQELVPELGRRIESVSGLFMRINPELSSRPGTTFLAAYFPDDEDSVYIASLGDSLALVYTGGKRVYTNPSHEASQMREDEIFTGLTHWLGAKSHPLQHMPHVRRISFKTNSYVVLASDGAEDPYATKVVGEHTDDELLGINQVMNRQSLSQISAREIVQYARNRFGNPDDITVLIARRHSEPAAWFGITSLFHAAAPRVKSRFFSRSEVRTNEPGTSGRGIEGPFSRRRFLIWGLGIGALGLGAEETLRWLRNQYFSPSAGNVFIFYGIHDANHFNQARDFFDQALSGARRDLFWNPQAIFLLEGVGLETFRQILMESPRFPETSEIRKWRDRNRSIQDLSFLLEKLLQEYRTHEKFRNEAEERKRKLEQRFSNLNLFHPRILDERIFRTDDPSERFHAISHRYMRYWQIPLAGLEEGTFESDILSALAESYRLNWVVALLLGRAQESLEAYEKFYFIDVEKNLVRDKALNQQILKLRQRHPQHVILHFRGKFHSENHDEITASFQKNSQYRTDPSLSSDDKTLDREDLEGPDRTEKLFLSMIYYASINILLEKIDDVLSKLKQDLKKIPKDQKQEWIENFIQDLSERVAQEELEDPNAQHEAALLRLFQDRGYLEVRSEVRSIGRLSESEKLKIIREAIKGLAPVDILDVKTLETETELSRDQIYSIGRKKLEEVGVVFQDPLKKMQADMKEEASRQFEKRILHLEEALEVLKNERPNREINFVLLAHKMKKLNLERTNRITLSKWFSEHASHPKVQEIREAIEQTHPGAVIKRLIEENPNRTQFDIRQALGMSASAWSNYKKRHHEELAELLDSLKRPNLEKQQENNRRKATETSPLTRSSTFISKEAQDLRSHPLYEVLYDFIGNQELRFPRIYIQKDDGSQTIFLVASYREQIGGIQELITKVINEVNKGVKAPFDDEERWVQDNHGIPEDRLYLRSKKPGALAPSPMKPQGKQKKGTPSGRRSEVRKPAEKFKGAELLLQRIVKDWDRIKQNGVLVFDMQETLAVRGEEASPEMIAALGWLLSEGVRVVVNSGSPENDVKAQVMNPLREHLRSQGQPLEGLSQVSVYADSGTLRRRFDANGNPIHDQGFIDYQKQFLMTDDIRETIKESLKEIGQTYQFFIPKEDFDRLKAMYTEDQKKKNPQADYLFPWMSPDLEKRLQYEPSEVALHHEGEVQAPYLRIEKNGEGMITALAVTRLLENVRHQVIDALRNVIKEKLGQEAADSIVLRAGGSSTIDIVSAKANKAAALEDYVNYEREQGRLTKTDFVYYFGDEVNAVPRLNDMIMLDYKGLPKEFQKMKIAALNPKPPQGLTARQKARVYYVGGKQEGNARFLHSLRDSVEAIPRTEVRAKKTNLDQLRNTFEYFKLGEIKSIWELPAAESGFTKSYFVETEKGPFVIAKTTVRKRPETLLWEASFRDLLKDHGLPYIPPLHQSREGTPYVQRGKNFFIVGDYKQGSRVAWGEIRGKKLAEAARVLAEFHKVTLKPHVSLRGENLRNEEYPYALGDLENPQAMKDFFLEAFAEIKPETVPKKYLAAARIFQGHKDFILNQIEALTRREPPPGATGFPKAVIHGDYNARNILFEGDKISGLIDFDYSRTTYRIQDFANGVTSLDFKSRPLDLRPLADFIQIYNHYADPKMTAEELKILPEVYRSWFLEGLALSTSVLKGKISGENEKSLIDWIEKRVADLRALDLSLQKGEWSSLLENLMRSRSEVRSAGRGSKNEIRSQNEGNEFMERFLSPGWSIPGEFLSQRGLGGLYKYSKKITKNPLAYGAVNFVLRQMPLFSSNGVFHGKFLSVWAETWSKLAEQAPLLDWQTKKNLYYLATAFHRRSERLLSEYRALFEILEEAFLKAHQKALPFSLLKTEKVLIDVEGTDQKSPGYLFLPVEAEWDPVPAIVIYHGFRERNMFPLFEDAIQEAVRQGAAVLLVDLPGHGENQNRVRTREDIEHFSKSNIDYLQGRGDIREDIFVVGLSVGGFVAFLDRLASQEDKNRLYFLINPPLEHTFRNRQILKQYQPLLQDLFEESDFSKLVALSGALGVNLEALRLGIVSGSLSNVRFFSSLADEVLSRKDIAAAKNLADHSGAIHKDFVGENHLPSPAMLKGAFTEVFERLTSLRSERLQKISLARLSKPYFNGGPLNKWFDLSSWLKADSSISSRSEVRQGKGTLIQGASNAIIPLISLSLVLFILSEWLLSPFLNSVGMLGMAFAVFFGFFWFLSALRFHLNSPIKNQKLFDREFELFIKKEDEKEKDERVRRLAALLWWQPVPKRNRFLDFFYRNRNQKHIEGLINRVTREVREGRLKVTRPLSAQDLLTQAQLLVSIWDKLDQNGSLGDARANHLRHWIKSHYDQKHPSPYSEIAYSRDLNTYKMGNSVRYQYPAELVNDLISKVKYDRLPMEEVIAELEELGFQFEFEPPRYTPFLPPSPWRSEMRSVEPEIVDEQELKFLERPKRSEVRSSYGRQISNELGLKIHQPENSVEMSEESIKKSLKPGMGMTFEEIQKVLDGRQGNFIFRLVAQNENGERREILGFFVGLQSLSNQGQILKLVYVPLSRDGNTVEQKHIMIKEPGSSLKEKQYEVFELQPYSLWSPDNEESRSEVRTSIEIPTKLQQIAPEISVLIADPNLERGHHIAAQLNELARFKEIVVLKSVGLLDKQPANKGKQFNLVINNQSRQVAVRFRNQLFRDGGVRRFRNEDRFFILGLPRDIVNEKNLGEELIRWLETIDKTRSEMRSFESSFDAASDKIQKKDLSGFSDLTEMLTKADLNQEIVRKVLELLLAHLSPMSEPRFKEAASEELVQFLTRSRFRDYVYIFSEIENKIEELNDQFGAASTWNPFLQNILDVLAEAVVINAELEAFLKEKKSDPKIQTLASKLLDHIQKKYPKAVQRVALRLYAKIEKQEDLPFLSRELMKIADGKEIKPIFAGLMLRALEENRSKLEDEGFVILEGYLLNLSGPSRSEVRKLSKSSDSMMSIERKQHHELYSPFLMIEDYFEDLSLLIESFEHFPVRKEELDLEYKVLLKEVYGKPDEKISSKIKIQWGERAQQLLIFYNDLIDLEKDAGWFETDLIAYLEKNHQNEFLLKQKLSEEFIIFQKQRAQINGQGMHSEIYGAIRWLEGIVKKFPNPRSEIRGEGISFRVLAGLDRSQAIENLVVQANQGGQSGMEKILAGIREEGGRNIGRLLQKAQEKILAPLATFGHPSAMAAEIQSPGFRALVKNETRDFEIDEEALWKRLQDAVGRKQEIERSGRILAALNSIREKKIIEIPLLGNIQRDSESLLALVDAVEKILLAHESGSLSVRFQVISQANRTRLSGVTGRLDKGIQKSIQIVNLGSRISAVLSGPRADMVVTQDPESALKHDAVSAFDFARTADGKKISKENEIIPSPEALLAAAASLSERTVEGLSRVGPIVRFVNEAAVSPFTLALQIMLRKTKLISASA
ncbi:MAG: phosphotransferase [Candidatus Omnitrophica bacterium]|nr:phosphotransferase [Candidatus Omnitrophota bacterium]